jgi:hypothetical protein
VRDFDDELGSPCLSSKNVSPKTVKTDAKRIIITKTAGSTLKRRLAELATFSTTSNELPLSRC